MVATVGKFTSSSSMTMVFWLDIALPFIVIHLLGITSASKMTPQRETQFT